MAASLTATSLPQDQPYFDQTAYGSGPDDFVTDTTENAAITHDVITLQGQTISYTATAGHLVARDQIGAKPMAKFFYVAFTADGADPTARPVTFFYNGGPGSSSVYVFLGSFAPMRIKTEMPGFTPPAPYTLEANPDSLLDTTDLVFVNPVGTGYSAAIAPYKNRDFWGVDPDARSIKQFIKAYLSKYDRWNSPKFLFGESYGTARTCVLTWQLHEDGLDLNGIVLQSSILDYAQANNPVGLLPTLAADAWFHKKINVTPMPADLPSFMTTVVKFAQTTYGAMVTAPQHANPAAVQTLSDDLGIAPAMLSSWNLDVSDSNRIGLSFLQELLRPEGLALGGYDGRVTAVETGIAGNIDPASGNNDPTMTAINGVYTVMWNTYLNDGLKFTTLSPFNDSNDQAFSYWDFHHKDPTGAEKGMGPNRTMILYTAGDLAAAMALNPALKVFSANGYFDSVTPFSQTAVDLANMPLQSEGARANLTIKNYPSGHMIYLDGPSRTAMKTDLAAFYASTTAAHRVLAQLRRQQPKCAPYYKRASGAIAAPAAAPRITPWEVTDLCRAYQWPTGLAGGGIIALVELDGGWTQADMDAYFHSINQPSPRLTDVSVDGTKNTPNLHLNDPDHDPDYEVALDIQVAAAAYYVATGKPAQIRIYWAANRPGGMAAAVRAARADGCDVCSISWGADEAIWASWKDQLGLDYIAQMETAATAAANAGVVVVASSGDNDSSDGGPTPANVDVPSSCPHVIGCGGTTKTAQDETVWNNEPGETDGSGTGGGYSRYFPMQSFQAGAPLGPGRMVPDVAANADPDTGYKFWVHGSSTTVGGTSAGAPLYAGLIAALGTKLGFISAKLWANHLCFNDITQGDNGYYRARIGPDPCTGLGSPIGTKMAALFRAAVATPLPEK